jgi:hypothetical protein
MPKSGIAVLDAVGLTSGVPDDTGKTAPDIYKRFRENIDDPSWKWPRELLPICHWGCGILSCVDCAGPNFRLRVFDPDAHEGDNCANFLFEEPVRFEMWIGEWASGVDLWELKFRRAERCSCVMLDRRASQGVTR